MSKLWTPPEKKPVHPCGWVGEIRRPKKHRAPEVIHRFVIPNKVTRAGLTLFLDFLFKRETEHTARNWYLGLIEQAGYSSTSTSDIMGSHAGWTEFTGYNIEDSLFDVRGQIDQGVLTGSSFSLTKPRAQCVISYGYVTFEEATSFRGFFVVDTEDHGDETGNLWSTAISPAAITGIIPGDQLDSRYVMAWNNDNWSDWGDPFDA